MQFFKEKKIPTLNMYTKSDRIIRESFATTSKHIKTYILAKVTMETYAFLHSTQWMAQSSLWRIGIAHTSSSTAHSLQAKDCKAGFRYCEFWLILFIKKNFKHVNSSNLKLMMKFEQNKILCFFSNFWNMVNF